MLKSRLLNNPQLRSNFSKGLVKNVSRRTNSTSSSSASSTTSFGKTKIDKVVAITGSITAGTYLGFHFYKEYDNFLVVPAVMLGTIIGAEMPIVMFPILLTDYLTKLCIFKEDDNIGSTSTVPTVLETPVVTTDNLVTSSSYFSKFKKSIGY